MSTSDDETAGGCEAASYDLARPPSREELGMQPGRSFMDVSCDQGFQVTLTLPDNVDIGVTARRVNADSHSAVNPETGPPTTVDVHSVALDTDEAVQLATDLAARLGIDAGPVQSWRLQVEDTPADNVDSPFLRNRVGYLTAEMQVQHLGASGNSYVHLILSWS